MKKKTSYRQLSESEKEVSIEEKYDLLDSRERQTYKMLMELAAEIAQLRSTVHRMALGNADMAISIESLEKQFKNLEQSVGKQKLWMFGRNIEIDA